MVERLSLPESCAEPLKSLRRIARSMAAYGIENINLDFSVSTIWITTAG
jgi:hypothetical protein